MQTISGKNNTHIFVSAPMASYECTYSTVPLNYVRTLAYFGHVGRGAEGEEGGGRGLIKLDVFLR